MAAKEEAVVLKYLKKNPGTEALDVSFGTDLDEAIVKETLQQLLSKQMVAVKVDAQGVATWTTAEPPKSAPAPKPVKVKADEPSESSAPDVSSFDAPGATGGTGKGFVFFIALLFSLISVGASWYLANMQIKAAKSGFDLQLKTTQEAMGLDKIQMNKDIDALKLEVKKLQAPPAAEEKAAEKPSKKAAKAAKKRKK